MESLLLIIGTGLLLASGVMYVLILGPSRYHRDGYVGALARFLSTLPSCFGECLCCVVCGGSTTRGKRAWGRCGGYVSGRNSILVMMYIIFFWPPEFAYILFCLPYLRAPYVRKCVSVSLVLISELLYGAAVWSDPGSVSTVQKVKRMLQDVTQAPKKKKKKSRSGGGGGALEQNASNSFSEKTSSQHSSRHSSWVGSTPSTIPSRNTPRVDTTTGGTEEGVGFFCSCFSSSLSKKASVASLTRSLEVEYCCNRRYAVDDVLYPLSPDPSFPHHSQKEKKGSSHSALLSRSWAATAESEYSGFRNALGHVVGFGMRCSTCGLPKPSRSKHCRYCNRCVRRFDHHCPWINNDVAENTQRYFIGFLFFHTVSCIWAALDLWQLMRQFLMDHRMWGWKMVLPQGRVVSLSLAHYLILLSRYQIFHVSLFLVAVLMGLILFIFTTYVFSFAVENITANDMEKIDTVLYFLDILSTPKDMYSGACETYEKLKDIYPRPHRLAALKSFPPPPSHLENLKLSSETGKVMNAPSTSTKTVRQLTKERKAYTRKLRSTLRRSLLGLYDRGILLNLREVFFPYWEVRTAQLEAARHWIPSATSAVGPPSTSSQERRINKKRKEKGDRQSTDGVEKTPSSSSSSPQARKTFYTLFL